MHSPVSLPERRLAFEKAVSNELKLRSEVRSLLVTFECRAFKANCKAVKGLAEACCCKFTNINAPSHRGHAMHI